MWKEFDVEIQAHENSISNKSGCFFAGRNGRGARFKKHVVEFNEGSGTQSRLVPAKENQNQNIPGEIEDEVAEV